MKSRSFGVLAVLGIAGIAVRRFRKWIVGSVFAVTIAGFTMFNVGLNSQNDLSAIYKANVEALATSEDCGCVVVCKCYYDQCCNCYQQECAVNYAGSVCAIGTSSNPTPNCASHKTNCHK
jgi:hypothetical protein